MYAQVADKWAVRAYVEEKVGDHVLNEVYHVTDDPSTIPFDSLPDEFVIKGTHGSGYVIVVEDKTARDFESIRSECREWLSERFGATVNEYWYDEFEPRIMVEKYIDVEAGTAPLDYKFYVFDGRVEYVHVDFGRFSHHTRRFYDRDWTSMDFERAYPLGPDVPEPERLDEMIELAEDIGEDFDFVRIDLFNPEGEEIVFGEMTLAPGAGQGRFEPTRYDFELGSHWKIEQSVTESN